MNNLIEISPDDLTPGLLLPIQEVMTKHIYVRTTQYIATLDQSDFGTPYLKV